MNARVINADALEALRDLEGSSVDSLVTDPPAGIAFMGKAWDAHGTRQRFIDDLCPIFKECFRVMKPGAWGGVWALPRTAHWTTLALEDAGFEIRDVFVHLFGSGFPKSMNVSKKLDEMQLNEWLKVSKAIDAISVSDFQKLVDACKENFIRAKFVGPQYLKSGIGTGTNMRKNDSVLDLVVLKVNLKSSLVNAIIADGTFSAAHLIPAENASSVLKPAVNSFTELKNRATIAEPSLGNPDHRQASLSFFAELPAWDSLNVNLVDKLRGGEALRTWLGSELSSKPAAFDALCVALIEDLKLITLSQSKTFRSFDTTSQTECASAISAIITEFTAESLISFTVDTLRRKAIDNAAGATREVVGTVSVNGRMGNNPPDASGSHIYTGNLTSNKPITDAAKQWDGYGTALKPASEHWIVIRKPLAEKTVAANLLKFGTGAINIDGCRIGGNWIGNKAIGEVSMHTGRWPANVVTSHHPLCELVGERVVKGDPREGGDGKRAGGFVDTGAAIGDGKPNGALYGDETQEVWDCIPGCAVAEIDAQSGDRPGCKSPSNAAPENILRPGQGAYQKQGPIYGDNGGASRFFYCAKPSTSEKQDALRTLSLFDANPETRPTKNAHPTVKPVSLMRWLIRLVTPHGGVVLDPFAGSGTTGVAAVLEGHPVILIEREADSAETARARVERAELTGAA